MNLMDYPTAERPLFAEAADAHNQHLADDIVNSIPPDRFANLETAGFGQPVDNNVECSPHTGTLRPCAATCRCGGEILATVILFLALIGAKVVIDRIVS